MKANAKNVESLADRKREENFILRQYLKFQDDLTEMELDEIVAHTARHVAARFDCRSCANCCRIPGTIVTNADIQRMSTALEISPDEFSGKYLMDKIERGDDDFEDDGSHRWRLRDDPCPFLEDNKCSIYSARPEQCRKYPYLHEPDFSSRTLGLIERTYSCPVTFQVFEELKVQLPYHQPCGEYD